MEGKGVGHRRPGLWTRRLDTLKCRRWCSFAAESDQNKELP